MANYSSGGGGGGTMTAAAILSAVGYFSTTVAEIDSGASAGTTLTLDSAFGGLNGDRDGWYEIDVHIVTPAGSGAIAYSLNINGGAAAIRESVTFTDAGAVCAVADGAFGISNAGTVNAGFISGKIKIGARTAHGSRAIQFDGMLVDTVTATKAIKGMHTRGTWHEAATNITSLTIAASSGNNIGIHSLATVRRPLTIT